MKVIAIEELGEKNSPNHYDLVGRTIFDSKGTKVTFSRMEKTGRRDPHVHKDAEQLFIVLTGELMFTTSEGETRVKPGNAALFHPGELHAHANAAEGETEYLTITARKS
jgi:quercetin dioxygenase-like cupin family protein